MSSPRLLLVIHAMAAAMVLSACVFFLHTPVVSADNPGDWPAVGHDPGNTGYNPIETALRPPFRQKWRDTFLNGPTYFHPIVANGMAFVVFSDYVSAIDTVTGRTTWRFPIGYHQGSLAAGDNGLVYVPSNSFNWTGGALYALDSQTGALAWKYDAAYIDYPVAADGVVYAVTGGGGASRIVAIDGTTGAPKWGYPSAQGTLFLSPPIVANGGVFVTTGNFSPLTSDIRALDAATGNLRWTYTVDPPSMSRTTLMASGGNSLPGRNQLHLRR